MGQSAFGDEGYNSCDLLWLKMFFMQVGKRRFKYPRILNVFIMVRLTYDLMGVIRRKAQFHITSTALPCRFPLRRLDVFPIHRFHQLYTMIDRGYHVVINTQKPNALMRPNLDKNLQDDVDVICGENPSCGERNGWGEGVEVRNGWGEEVEVCEVGEVAHMVRK